MERSFVPTLTSEVADRVRLGIVHASPVVVRPAPDALVQSIDELANELRDRYAGKSPSEITALESARKLYRAFGVDPTRTRPSSEALLRRALQGKPLPRISNAVDVCNYCSLRFLLPIGLYDTAKLRGEIVVRAGRPEESYAGIRKDVVGVEGRLVLSDDDGAFGNPSSDSFRTSVDEGTTSLLMVVFAPRQYPGAQLGTHASYAAEILARDLAAADGATRTSTAVLPSTTEAVIEGSSIR